MAASETAWLDELAETLTERGFLDRIGEPVFERLTGGVSSDIWTISRGGRRLVVKRALAKLRVAQEWLAPVSRNAAEARYLAVAHAILPDAVPDVMLHDEAAGLFVMAYIPPDTAPVWKAQLLKSEVDPAFAGAVGRIVGQIHDATAGRPEIAEQFDNGQSFHALRVSPYLEATAQRHPDLAGRILDISRTTAETRLCLIHGDVSPKNILAGPEGPILLDAECATFGDPAFDLAFCLNHLLLKGVRVPEAAALEASFAALTEGYFAAAGIADRTGTEGRAAALLPALFLARIDGKSPVEYITDDADKELVRRVAAEFIRSPTSRLSDISGRWREALQERQA